MQVVLAVLAAALVPCSADARQVERLTLERMVARTEDALFGEIVGKRVFRVDHPVDGPELYFTVLSLRGYSLRDGSSRTVEVLYPGGFLDERHGVHNSEAPAEEDVRLGNHVVVFTKHVENLGGGVAGRALYGSHAGLYRTVLGPKGRVVLGRGEGYAISFNRKLGDLQTAVRSL